MKRSIGLLVRGFGTSKSRTDACGGWAGNPVLDEDVQVASGRNQSLRGPCSSCTAHRAVPLVPPWTCLASFKKEKLKFPPLFWSSMITPSNTLRECLPQIMLWDVFKQLLKGTEPTCSIRLQPTLLGCGGSATLP